MTMGRPLEYEPDTVLEAAMQLFWQQGYEATSLHDLLREMKLSKSSLYQAFGSKHKLFLRCIERYHYQMMAEMWDRLLNANSGLQFVSDTFAIVITEANELANPKGCLMTNTANEFAQSDTQIALKVAHGLDGYCDMFCKAILKGQSDGSIRTDITADKLASYLVTNMNGLRTMVKAGTDEKILQQTVHIIISSIT
jgi:TetR/AcrR family transcriptional regulator, transcriptional repressor for nem operon